MLDNYHPYDALPNKPTNPKDKNKKKSILDDLDYLNNPTNNKPVVSEAVPPNLSILSDSSSIGVSNYKDNILTQVQSSQPVSDKKDKNIPAGVVQPFYSSLGQLSAIANSATKPVITSDKSNLDRWNLYDTAKTRQAIFDSVLGAIKSINAIENKNYRLEIIDPHYDKKETFSIEEQKKAILSNSSLFRKIVGKLRLIDKASNNVIDEKEVTLAHVPYYTNRGSFILNGNEYHLSNQIRLRSGIYHRIKDNGEIEAHINPIMGTGPTHRYRLEPNTGVFKLDIGQASIPLLPVLKALGATDENIISIWGNEVYRLNKKYDDPKIYEKLYQRFIPNYNPAMSEKEKRQLLQNYFQSMRVESNVTKITLGHPFESINKDAILASTKKLLLINRGQADVDERDALVFQKYFGPDAMFAERINRSKLLLNKLLWRATFKKNLSPFQSGFMTDTILEAIYDSGLGQPTEETNPVFILDQIYRVSKLGYGGIPSLESVSDEARSVQPSQIPFVDPIVTPENLSIGVDARFSSQLLRDKDGNIYQKFINRKTNEAEYLTPQQVFDKTVTFKAELDNDDVDYIPAVKNNKIVVVKKDEVDYIIPSYENSFSPMGNLVSLKSSCKAQRGSMGSRMSGQAVPLVQPEAPLVQTGLGDGSGLSYNRVFGSHVGAIFAKDVPGIVKSVEKDKIIVNYDDGTVETYHLYNNFPFNRKSVTGDTVVYIRRQLNHSSKKVFHYFSCEIQNYVFNKNDEILSINSNSEPTWSKIYAFTAHDNDKKTLKVTTETGKYIKATSDHSFVVLRDNKLKVVNGDELKLGDLIPVVFFPSNSYSSENVNNYVKFPGDGYLIGTFLASGTIAEGKPAHNTKNKKKTVDTNEKYVLFNLPQQTAVYLSYYFDSRGVHTVSSHKGARLTVKDKWFVNFFSQFGKPGNRVIPNWVFELSSDNVANILAGIIGEGGIVENDRITISFIDKSAYLCAVQLIVKLGLPYFVQEENKQYFIHLPFSKELIELPTISSYPFAERHIRKTIQNFGLSNELYENKKFEKIVDISVLNKEDYKIVYDFSVDESELFATTFGLIVHNTYIHNTPTVEPGQKISPGQLLAKSNYTDDKGEVAIGANLKVAYVPFGGLNYEDAFVISESAAKKLSSVHMYQYGKEFDENSLKGKKVYMSIFPMKYNRSILENFDEDGVVKPGTRIAPNTPLILSVTARPFSSKTLYSGKKGSYLDTSEVWDYDTEGIVTDVYKDKNKVTVTVQTISSARVGDKLAGRYGNKGVIAYIFPDEYMPKDSNGETFDILANPTGISGRGNPSAILETALGKIAKKTGKPFVIDDFNRINNAEFVMNELKKHGLSDTEQIVDPQTGKNIDNVMTGYSYYMKLHHMAEGKGVGRGLGSYTSEEMPAKGGEHGSKRTALMNIHALLAHGATEVIRDAKLIRGQKNAEFWSMYMSGVNPPTPKIPLVYSKFMDQLRASGINVVRQGSKIHLYAMTQKDIDQLVGNRELQNGETIDVNKDMKPISGGLFDISLTGGHNGNRWSYIKLPEKFPNPVVEEPLRRLLGLTKREFDSILIGKSKINDKTGPEALYEAIARIDIDKALAQAIQRIKGGRGDERDNAIKVAGYLQTCKKYNVHPKDWFIDKMPVIPPIFRPVSVMAESGTSLVADANYLYKDLLESSQVLKELKGKTNNLSNELANVYQAMKAVIGLGDPVMARSSEKSIKGFLRNIFGSSSKYGAVQQKLIGYNSDLVGRAVVVPDPNFSIDEIGIPEAKAWEVYSPIIVRRLVRSGIDKFTALNYVKERNEIAKKALLAEMSERPVLVDRAPVLHKYGMLAFWPKLVKGDTLHVCPFVVTGFGMDFDGDTSNYHVPVSEEAKKEAVQKLLPSKNVISLGDLQSVMNFPRHEYATGIWMATNKVNKNKSPMIFPNSRAVVEAFYNGKVDFDQPITILNP